MKPLPQTFLLHLTKNQEMEHKSKTKDNTNTFTFAPPVNVQGHQGCAYKRRFEFGLETPVNPDRLDAPVSPDRLWMMRRFSNLEKQLWEIQVDIRTMRRNVERSSHNREKKDVTVWPQVACHQPIVVPDAIFPHTRHKISSKIPILATRALKKKSPALCLLELLKIIGVF